MANEFKVKNGLIVVGDLTTSGTITINGALAATQSWVTSQAYLTSASLTSYATQTYVNNAVAALVDSAPAALDTLNELATALGNDASFSTTVTTSIGNKVSKSGDTMTGNLSFGATSNLGLTWGLNTDAAFIKFVSTGNQAGGSYLEIGTQDDLDEEIKFTQSGSLRFYLATDGFLKNASGYKYVFENGTWGINISGNASTATTFSTSRTNYKGITDGAVAGQLMWKNYGNQHTIFDASQSTSPDGGAVGNTNSSVAWTATYPTLMGWNGSQTYGVRVDSARLADTATTADALTSMNISQFTNNSGYITASALSPYLPLAGGTMSGSITFSSAYNAYIYTFSRVGLANQGRIIYNNGTGSNMFFGELASNIYGFTSNAYTDTPALSFNLSTNNVGIGTSTPGSKLHVISNENADAAGAIRTTALNLSQYADYSFGGITSSYFYRIVSGTNQHISLMPGGTGNVGIGTTSPSQKLQVNGSAEINSSLYVGADIVLTRADTTPALLFTTQNGLRWTYTGGGNYWTASLSIDSANLINMNGSPLATRGWVNSQGFLTSVSDIWVNTAGDTMSGTLSFQQPVGLSFANGQYIKDNNSGGLIIYSGAAVNINGTSIAVTGAATFSSSLTVGSRLALQPSNFGYASSYKTLLIGSAGTDYTTNAVSLAFNVDVSGNPNGAFNGSGQEYIWRNAGVFITPNAANTSYNTLFSWNSSGQLTFNQATTLSSSLTVERIQINSTTYEPLAINSSYGQVGLKFGLNGTYFAAIGSATNVTGAYAGSETDLGLGTSGSATANITFATGAGYLRRVTITAAGNVGIDTTAPTNKLQIGSVGSSGYGGNDIVIGNGTQVMAFYQSSTISAWYTNTNFALLASGAGSTGNLGIGTSSPGDYKLYVNGGQFGTLLRGGDLGTGSDVVRMIKSDGSCAMIVRGDGNIGIGTFSPTQRLDVDGNISLGSWTKPGSTYVGLRRADDGSFGGGGDSGLVIESYGHASPYAGDYSQRVHLRTHLYNGGSHNVLTAYGLNVGIGTSTPGTKLDVNGVITATGGNSTNWNTAFGWGNHASADYIVKGTQILSSASWPTATRFGSVGDISQDAGNHALSVRSENGNDAFMSFHIGGDYAVHFGLDRVSNRMSVGGWSDGAVKYQLWDTRDFTSTNVSNWNTAYSWGNHASASYATTSYVTTQINNLIAGAPGALDTLDELAAALGDDSNFATTVTNSIAGKVSKSGDTMTGVLNLNGGLYVSPAIDFGRSAYSTQYANIILLPTDNSPSGYSTIEFKSGYNYPSDGASITYMASTAGSGEDSEFLIRLNNDADDHIKLQAGYIVCDANTLNGGSYTTPFYWKVVGDTKMTLGPTGNLTISGTLTESSSIKLKENIETSEGNLEKVVNLRPVTYNKIGSQTKELGLIAEEVATVYPEFVQYDENGEPIGVNYSRLTAALIGAVKELTQRIETLENNG